MLDRLYHLKLTSLRHAVNVRCPLLIRQIERRVGGDRIAMLLIKRVLIIFSQFASPRVQLNMRIMEHGVLLLVIAITAAVLPEANARQYACNKNQGNKSRRCNSKEKSEHHNPYPSRVFKMDKYVKVQSFYEFFFGGFVRPFTGRLYDGIQRMYPENRKTPKVLGWWMMMKKFELHVLSTSLSYQQSVHNLSSFLGSLSSLQLVQQKSGSQVS